MGLSLGGIGAFLGNAVTPLTNVVAANANAEAEGNREKVQVALRNYGLKRQADQDKMAAALNAAKIEGMKGQKVTYRLDADGNYVALPTTVDPSVAPDHQAAPAPAPAPSFDGPSSQDWAKSLRQVSPSQATPPSVSTAPGQAPPQQASPPAPLRTLGIQTGVKGPAKAPPRIDPNSPAGIAADSTRTANHVAINNSAPAITGDSLKKANAQQIKVTNPLPSRAGTGAGEPMLKTIGPDGSIVYTPRSQAAGKQAPGGGGMGGGMGAGGIGGIARTDGAITEMRQAHDMMSPYENALKAGKASYDGLDYFMGLASKMYDAHGIVDQAKHSAAFGHLNQTNPALANYLRAAEMWSLADGAISGRTSDFRTKMDAFVSSIGPHTGSVGIDQVQGSRLTRLQKLEAYQPAMAAIGARVAGGARGGKGGAPSVGTPNRGTDPGGDINLGGPAPASPLRQKYDAAVAHLKGQKKTDQEIHARLGDPPGGE